MGQSVLSFNKELKAQDMRLCSYCFEVSSLDNFYFIRKEAGVISNRCKPCTKVHRSTRNEGMYRRSMYYYLNKSTLQNYGITREDYVLMREKQGDKCYICGKEHDGGRSTGLCLDHNHQTGALRAFLCRRCNMALSIVEDTEYLERLFNYLEEFK